MSNNAAIKQQVITGLKKYSAKPSGSKKYNPMQKLFRGGGSQKVKVLSANVPATVYALNAVHDSDATVIQPEERERELANKLISEVETTGSDVGVLCETYMLKREELGRLTGFSLRALAEWAGGKAPSQPAKRRLQEVRRFLDALSQIVKRERIPGWLHERNKAFDNLTPLQIIEYGEIDRLWAMVHHLGGGSPG